MKTVIYQYLVLRRYFTTEFERLQGVFEIEKIHSPRYITSYEDFKEFLRYLPKEIECMTVELPEEQEMWIWQRHTHPKYGKTNDWQIVKSKKK